MNQANYLCFFLQILLIPLILLYDYITYNNPVLFLNIQYYKNIDALLNTTKEELLSIEDIGTKIAQSVYETITQEKFINLITDLKNLGLNMNYIEKEQNINEFFNGKTFVLTGTLSSISRDEAKEIIESKGGKATSSVTKKTSYVIVGENPGSKYDKAKELNIEIINEKEFMDKINS